MSKAASTGWFAEPVASRLGRAIEHHLNDLSLLEDELRDLHGELIQQWQRAEREPPSRAAAAMLQHERQRRGGRIKPLPPETTRAAAAPTAGMAMPRLSSRLHIRRLD